MKHQREEKFPKPSPVTPPPAAPPGSGANPGRSTLSECWRSLPTGLRGTRLYRVTLPGGGGVYWAAAPLHGQSAQRRFASELHARAWLTLATAQHPSAVPFDLEELNGPFRAARVAATDRAARRAEGKDIFEGPGKKVVLCRMKPSSP